MFTLDHDPVDGGHLIVAGGEVDLAATSEMSAIFAMAAAGPQDMVILAVKAHQLEAVANDVPKLFGRDTVVVTMQNGIPYWYFHQHGGALAGYSRTPLRAPRARSSAQPRS